MNMEREKVLREMKSKHAAQLAARPDLSQDQINAVSEFGHRLLKVLP